MIMEVRKRVSKELTLAVAERAREEESWPTDLWKKMVRIGDQKMCVCQGHEH